MDTPQSNESTLTRLEGNTTREHKPSPRPLEPPVPETEMAVPQSQTADTGTPNPVMTTSSSYRPYRPPFTEPAGFSSSSLQSRRAAAEAKRRYNDYLLTLTPAELCAHAIAKVNHDRLTGAPDEPRKMPNFVCLWDGLNEEDPGTFIKDPFAADRERQAGGEEAGVESEEEAKEPISPTTKPKESIEMTVKRLWGYLSRSKESR